MNAELRQAIDNANRKAQAARNKVFVKKSSDEQMLDHVTLAGRVAVDIFNEACRSGLVVSTNLRSAMKELGSSVVLSERRISNAGAKGGRRG